MARPKKEELMTGEDNSIKLESTSSLPFVPKLNIYSVTFKDPVLAGKVSTNIYHDIKAGLEMYLSEDDYIWIRSTKIEGATWSISHISNVKYFIPLLDS